MTVKEAAIEESLQEEEETEDLSHSEALYSEYTPKLFTKGVCHPDKLAESSSLSSVSASTPTYQLKLYDHLVAHNLERSLSNAQLETIILAYQASENYFTYSDDIVEHLGRGEVVTREINLRKGFFLGDGAGVGKGRQLAGFVLECVLNGLDKALWLSSSADLYIDAKRDMDDIGCTESIKQLVMKNIPYGKIQEKSGVLFATYASLISSSASKGSRLEQIVNWLGGASFHGAIIFDEGHKAKNLVPATGQVKPTKTGIAVKDLQLLLPNARIVYASATGCSEPSHLGYMLRLGLWGSSTCFVNFDQFKRAIDQAGYKLMELISLHLKREGQYLSRTLSYEKADFDIIENKTSDAEKGRYDQAVFFWHKLLGDLEENLHISNARAYLSKFPGWYEKVGGKRGFLDEYEDEDDDNFDEDDEGDVLDRADVNRPMRLPPSSIEIAGRTIRRHFWGNHQRFFRAMCMSLKVGKVIELAEQDLAKGHAIVIGLQSTGESATSATVENENDGIHEFVSAPAYTLKRTLIKLFPMSPNPDALLDQTVLETEIDGKKRKAGAQVEAPPLPSKRVSRPTKPTIFNISSDEGEDVVIQDAPNLEVCSHCKNSAVYEEWVACDMCDQWLHVICERLKRPPPEGESYTCRRCIAETSAETIESDDDEPIIVFPMQLGPNLQELDDNLTLSPSRVA